VRRSGQNEAFHHHHLTFYQQQHGLQLTANKPKVERTLH
jgi:hypothetical protein